MNEITFFPILKTKNDTSNLKYWLACCPQKKPLLTPHLIIYTKLPLNATIWGKVMLTLKLMNLESIIH